MSSSVAYRHIDNLRKIFLKGVESVRPSSLFSNDEFIEKIESKGSLQQIRIRGKSFDLNKKCHLVGFGKAVLGMAVQMERILDKRLVSGVLSVPIGTTKRFHGVEEMQLAENSVIRVHEGAADNLPDDSAVQAANEIMKLAASLQSDDVLFVLISGGGSALLPLPKSPLTLAQKLNVIRLLTSKGASIDELNLVRIAMSATKGGKLAEAGRNASDVISLVISDIVDDPIDLIASGPTIAPVEREVSPRQVLEKYGIWPALEDSVRLSIDDESQIGSPTNNSLFIIGSNKVATEACAEEICCQGYIPFILTTSMQGNVKDVLDTYKKTLELIVNLKAANISVANFVANLPFEEKVATDLVDTIHESAELEKPLCLIVGGETTVHVTGTGKGGRSQELALRMSLELHKNPLLRNICFLAAGTDGIDGPTPAAGAIACTDVIAQFQTENALESAEQYLENSDSYNFYNRLADGKFHVITGHTGTNVMDLHLIVVP